MKKFPNNIVYSRPHKIKTIKGVKGINLSRFTAGYRIKESCYLSYEHLENARRSIMKWTKQSDNRNKKNAKMIQRAQKNLVRNFRKQKAKRKKLLYIRSNLCLPLTKKPLQVRMGKGKGLVDRWVYAARKSRVVFEMSQQQYSLNRMRKFFSISRYKLPVKGKFTFNRSKLRRETNIKQNNLKI
jgi:large subunit ribosomal protein L16